MGKVNVCFASVLTLVLLLSVGVQQASAFGMGPYLSYHTSEAEYEEGGSDDAEYSGFGVVLDTAVAKSSVMSYRLHLGYEEWDGDFVEYYKWNGNDLEKETLDGYSIVLDNTFAFKVFAKKAFKLWVGPQVHLSYSNLDIPLKGSSGTTYKDSVDFFGIGVGAVFGANFNLPVVTISPSIGVRYQYNASDTLEETTCYNSYCYEDDVDYSYDEVRAMLSVDFIFRMGDHYN